MGYGLGRSPFFVVAMILFRKEQEKDQELTELERGKDSDESRFISRKHSEPVDEKYNGDESFTHPMIAMREAAGKQQEGVEARKKAMDLMEYSETEYLKKQARDN